VAESGTREVAVIGGGPAGLMAAEAAAACGASVVLYDAMPSVGRKILVAGKGGLNLTHGEPFEIFASRFDVPDLRRHLETFGPTELRTWAETLGIPTVRGSSGRIFPADYKAAPLLRRWLHRLREQGVRFAIRHRWLGWTSTGALRFDHLGNEITATPVATVFALGGASWPRLGSDGAWVAPMAARGIPIAALKPANCGFSVNWSPHLRQRFAGYPVKSIAVTATHGSGNTQRIAGEFVVAEYGVEGGPFYALSATLRDQIAHAGHVLVALDLTPRRSAAQVVDALAKPRGKRSVSEHLRRTLGLEGVKVGLLYECAARIAALDPAALAQVIKSLPLALTGTRPLAEAISTAGGVLFEALDSDLMLKMLPGHFCAGEMLDWEAPTGGYLLTACLATGRTAGLAAARYQRS
jgi:uncharacterized flavoprotein (TIGR03862 family)